MKSRFHPSTPVAGARAMLGICVGLLLSWAAFAAPIHDLPPGSSTFEGLSASGMRNHDIGKSLDSGSHTSKKPKKGASNVDATVPCQGATTPSASVDGKGGRSARSKSLGPRRGKSGAGNTTDADSGSATGTGDCAGGGSTNVNGNTSPGDNTAHDDSASPGSDNATHDENASSRSDDSPGNAESSDPFGAVGNHENDESDPLGGLDLGDHDSNPLGNPGSGGEWITDLEIPGASDIGGHPGSPGDGLPGTSFDVIATNGTVPDVVPEPGSLALIGLGLAGLAACRRRKPK